MILYLNYLCVADYFGLSVKTFEKDLSATDSIRKNIFGKIGLLKVGF